MDNSKQVETVKKVLELEKYVENMRYKHSQLNSERYLSEPNPPVCETITRIYPKIEPQVRFDWVKAIVPTLFFWPWILIYYFKFYKKEQKEDIKRIRNSAEYKAQCAKLDEEFDRQQEIANQKYKTEKNIYETETLPKYRREFQAWTDQHSQKIQQTESKLRDGQKTLDLIYETTKIVPIQYRKIEILQYIYNLISTSDYDVKQAIDVYDRNEQRRLDTARLREQQQANALADEQNDLLYEQNKIADKARKDANKAAVIGTIQRHNTNKVLKSFKK